MNTSFEPFDNCDLNLFELFFLSCANLYVFKHLHFFHIQFYLCVVSVYHFCFKKIFLFFIFILSLITFSTIPLFYFYFNHYYFYFILFIIILISIHIYISYQFINCRNKLFFIHYYSYFYNCNIHTYNISYKFMNGNNINIPHTGFAATIGVTPISLSKLSALFLSYVDIIIS